MAKLLKAVFVVPVAFLVVFIVRFIHPWKKVRFGEFWTHRIGHLIGNTEAYLCEKDAGKHDGCFDIWVPARISANKAIEKKYRKILHVCPRWFGEVLFKVSVLFPDWKKHFAFSVQLDRDIYNLWEKHSPHIGFTEKEEKKGRKLLKSLGIPDGSKWVCIIARDPSYLQVISHSNGFSYHDYRDMDVSNFAQMAMGLVKRGYYVIRMGSIVKKPFLIKHSHIIDYPLSGKRSEFGDLYLGAKCSFCIGSATGFMMIPQAFNRPIAFVNHTLLEYSPTFYKGLMIWKHHIKDGKRMTLEEIFASGAGQFTFKQQFEENGITLEENDSTTLYKIGQEMADWVEGKYTYDDQKEFWDRFPLKGRSESNGLPLHGEARLRIGKDFLENYLKEIA